MLRDVPHCKCILKCGVGALVFAIVMMTWVYPAYCARVMQVKEQKVEEYVEGTYGIHAGTLNSLIDTGQPARVVPEPAPLPPAASSVPRGDVTPDGSPTQAATPDSGA
ncbi:MAG TPA: hypothetical protein DEP45_12595 [Armatimonadetes bacterium]|nr:hypothetical protein [Armatimonadota bacterium]